MAAPHAAIRANAARPLHQYRVDPVGDLRLADAARFDTRQLPAVVLIEADRVSTYLPGVAATRCQCNGMQAKKIPTPSLVAGIERPCKA